MSLQHEAHGARTRRPDLPAAARAELALQASETRYRQLIERAPLGVFIQCEGRFAFLNPKAVALFGAALEADLLGRSMIDFLLPEDRDAVLERVRRLSHERAIGPSLQATWLRLDGSTFPGEAAAVPCEHEGRPAALVMLQDISARRETEAQRSAALEALRNKDEEIHAIVDNLAECVITIDSRGLVRSANPALTRVLGYEAAEVIGRNVSMLMPEPHRNGHEGHLERYLRTGEADVIGTSREVEGRHKGGQLVALELTVTQCVVRGERVFLGLMRDIGERKRLIAELTEARAMAEAASRMKSAFLATMSHEIRTPMNGVMGMVELLASSPLTGDQAELVRTLRESASALLDIVDEVLDFSKIEAGRLEIERAPVDVRGLVEVLCRSMVPVAARGSVDLSWFASPTLPGHVIADEMRLRQVLYNLVGNAVKFSTGRPGRRGTVRVRAEVAGEARPRLVFTVADNGVGMTTDTLRNLFTPFTQAEVSTTRRFGGTGLGLAICRRLVDLMQGEISVESFPGAGSTFVVSLPCELAAEGLDPPTAPDSTGAPDRMTGIARADAHPANAGDRPIRPAPLASQGSVADFVDRSAPPGVEEARAKGRLILVAEDDEINRRVIARQLAHLGYASEIARDGEEALRLWHVGGHALLLTDLNMPVTDGLALARAIRREEGGRRRIPIVALTANALRSEANQAWAAGMDDCITKPVKLEKLGAALEKWLALAAAPAVEEAPRDERRDQAPGRAVDITVLIGAIGGDEAKARGLLADYRESARRSARELYSACAAGDLRAVERAAHRLKSSSRSVGARAMGERCERIERAGRSGDAKAAVKEVRGFYALLADVETDIARILARR